MATITEDYVSSELAKLLKEKGFYSEDCFAFYKKNGEICFLQIFGDIADYDSDTCVIAPTLQMAMKWLRLTHKIYIQALAPVYDMDCAELGVTYNVIITNLANQCLAFDTPLEDIEYNSPEEAYEVALKYCLENLI